MVVRDRHLREGGSGVECILAGPRSHSGWGGAERGVIRCENVKCDSGSGHRFITRSGGQESSSCFLCSSISLSMALQTEMMAHGTAGMDVVRPRPASTAYWQDHAAIVAGEEPSGQ